MRAGLFPQCVQKTVTTEEKMKMRTRSESYSNLQWEFSHSFSIPAT